MKLSRLLCTVLSLMCVACAPKPLIYNPSDSKSDPTGQVKPLSALLPEGSRVRLIFVHGVGDHCPGYALDPKDGWLKQENAAAMGLTPVSDEKLKPQFTDVSVYMKGPKDGRSGVWYATKDYRLTLPGRADISVQAIEITWSPLTQWIKTAQLGYDSPSAFTDKDKPGCLQDPVATTSPTVQAPWRVPLNKKIKEEVFDRNLADAMLYAGTYRETIERGLAEGICHAITHTSNDAQCFWPSAQDPVSVNYKNIFVTHSLGSRMTYDLFLDLMSTEKNNIFPADVRQQARPFIEQMLADTPAFYMMANQFVLLGLANVPPDSRSHEVTTHPFAFRQPLGESDIAADGSSPLSPSTRALVSERPGVSESSAITSGPRAFGNVLFKIGALKAQIAQKTGKPAANLEIISFNDTNDLLTWHVPSAYVSEKGDAAGRSVPVNVTDVFVHNAPRWLYLFEGPTGAHVNYFNNPAVRDIIRCGGSGSEVFKCAD